MDIQLLSHWSLTLLASAVGLVIFYFINRHLFTKLKRALFVVPEGLGLHILDLQNTFRDTTKDSLVYDFDIVVVHGLAANPKHTWSVKGGTNWLWDFLPKDFPGARVVAFNYDSRYLAFAPSTSPYDYGRELIASLKQKLHDNESSDQLAKNRQLVFVGHSFGGLVIKRALVLAATDNQYKDLAERVLGAIFLGTPHGGSSASSLGLILCKLMSLFGSNDETINFLGNSSSGLLDLDEEYKRLYPNYAFTFCFFETLRQRFFWFFSTQVVTKKSATMAPGGRRHMETDHSGLNKFKSRDDENYLKVCAKILDMANNSTKNDYKKIDLSKLPQAVGATFDSRLEENNSVCLSGTREKILCKINAWTEDPQGQTIFWMNGIAGTGKSTISRTVAQQFADDGALSASFFFKKGEGDRGSANMFITTLAAQMISKIPEMVEMVGKAIENDPQIARKRMSEQFDKLILQPLLNLRLNWKSSHSTQLIVIDALDECEQEGDIRLLLDLLSGLHKVSKIRLRVFLTSRKELPIDLGFKRMSDETHQDFVLHDIPKEDIDHDIYEFLKTEMERIRKDRYLPPAWPGNETVKSLVEMASPLFIYVATMCLFLVQKGSRGPDEQLKKWLSHRGASKLDSMYKPVLDRLVEGIDMESQEELLEDFKAIVGTIINLQTPLSANSLAQLLCMQRDAVYRRLELLHSVLSIPSNPDYPINWLHLSFCEFLMDNRKRDENYIFWVDKAKSHGNIAMKCLQIMNGSLKENICNLDSPGISPSDIDRNKIENCIPAEVRYACRYWMSHIQSCLDLTPEPAKGQLVLLFEEKVCSFFKSHFLHWLEVMGILQWTHETVPIGNVLQSLESRPKPEEKCESYFLFYDARRFIIRYRYIIEQAPLQLYSSALVFSPSQSIIRNQFKNVIPKWISKSPETEADWGAELQALEGHTGRIRSMAVSPNGKILASGSSDRTIRLWDTETGAALQTLEKHQGSVHAITFSPDGTMLASVAEEQTDRTILWNAQTGQLLHTLQTEFVVSFEPRPLLMFSPDGELLARGLTRAKIPIVQVWNTDTGHESFRIQQDNDLADIVFTAQNNLLVSCSRDDHLIRAYDMAGEIMRTFEHKAGVVALAAAPGSNLIASCSEDGAVTVWNVESGEIVQVLQHDSKLENAQFAPNGYLIICCYEDGTVILWNALAGSKLNTLHYDKEKIMGIIFSPDTSMVLAKYDDSMYLMDARSGKILHVMGWHESSVEMFSHDSKRIYSGTKDHLVRIWNVSNDTRRLHSEHEADEEVERNKSYLQKHFFSEPFSKVQSLEFSADGMLAVSCSTNSKITLWQFDTNNIKRPLETVIIRRELEGSISASLSPDGKLLASHFAGETVRLWEISTTRKLETLHIFENQSNVIFSSNSKLVAAYKGPSYDSECNILLWDVEARRISQILKGHEKQVISASFSRNAKFIVTCSMDEMVRVWNVKTGQILNSFIVPTSNDGLLIGFGLDLDAVALSDDGSLVAAATADSATYVWNVSTGETVQSWDHDIWRDAISLAFSPQNDLLASRNQSLMFVTNITTAKHEGYDVPHKIPFVEDHKVSFYEDSPLMHTSIGSISVKGSSSTINSCAEERSLYYNPDDGWIQINGKNLLWVPSDYRPSRCAFSNNNFAFGTRKGEVIFISIDLSLV